MPQHIELGRKGEALAAKYLKNKGYTIKHSNYTYAKAEIDLIVQKGPFLVFVEVKTRTKSGGDHGFPEEAVTRKKAKHIFRAANQYIFATNWQGEIRFDVISIVTTPSLEIMHFEDAFY